MRIGTWNVQYAAGRQNNERRLRRIQEMDCDIWVLTETHDDLALGATYHAESTTPRRLGRAGARWTTIWSRFPPMKRLTVLDPNRTVAALFECPVGPLLVYGTVLPWGSDRGPDGNAAGWTEHHRIIPIQANEWASLQAAHTDATLCIAGDLNMNLGGPHYYGTAKGRTLLRAGLAAADLVCVTGTELVPRGLLSHGPIDHICISRRWAREARVVGAWEGIDGDGHRLSDHSGLAVDVAPPLHDTH
jgi:endonuclease/exonuclease/phosphatase family metal-dependent hydrolase